MAPFAAGEVQVLRPQDDVVEGRDASALRSPAGQLVVFEVNHGPDCHVDRPKDSDHGMASVRCAKRSPRVPPAHIEADITTRCWRHTGQIQFNSSDRVGSMRSSASWVCGVEERHVMPRAFGTAPAAVPRIDSSHCLHWPVAVSGFRESANGTLYIGVEVWA